MKSSVQSVALLVLLAASLGEGTSRLSGEFLAGSKDPNALPRRYTKESRAVGGETSTPGFAPYQASIQNQYGNHICGGAIIDNSHILTAASCVAGLQRRNVIVVTGTNDWTSYDDAHDVESITIHCNFDKPLYHNDIAILKLTQPLVFNARVQKIALPEDSALVDGETLIMTGWGSVRKNGEYSRLLKQLEVTYLPAEKCKPQLGNTDNVDVGHMCTQPKPEEGSCHGDGGNPLVNSKGELVGIANWSIACAHGFPEVYADTVFYQDFIRTHIKGCNIPFDGISKEDETD